MTKELKSSNIKHDSVLILASVMFSAAIFAVFAVLNNRSMDSLRTSVKISQQESNPLKSKLIIYDGDSITESRENNAVNDNGGAYPKLISKVTGGTYKNYAVGGGTLSYEKDQSKHSVVENLSSLQTDGDIYCFSGGVNDWWTNRPLGKLTKGYSDAVDESTVIGALESIFRYATTNFLGKPVIFVITPKVKNPYWSNGSGYTQFDLHDAIVSVCKKYSIPFYDAFENSGFSGENITQSNEFTAHDDQTNSELGGGTHLNRKGYQKFFVPQIISLLNSIVYSRDII